MIQLQNITKSFGDLLLYENLSLAVAEGQRIALVAKNGAGKSTLLNIMAGREGVDAGSVVFRNGISVGYLPQEPFFDDTQSVIEAVYHADSELMRTVNAYERAVKSGDAEQIAHWSGRMDALGGWSVENRIATILSRLRIPDSNQRIGTLSGGQRKRLALAQVLIDDHDVMILDEPTNHLDLAMAQWLEDYLITEGKTLFMVTHDRYFLDRICTDIYELDDSRLYGYRGNYEEYLLRREERIERFNNETDKARNLFRRELEWMRRMPQARGTKAKYRKEAFYETKEKAFRRKHEEAADIRVGTQRLGSKIFEMKEVSKSFGAKKILDCFSYTFSRYEKLGVVGDNGTGKTTFLELLTGGLVPDSGVVEIGESVRFGYYRQQGMAFDERMKVIDAVKAIAEVVTLDDGRTVTASQLLTRFLFPPQSQQTYIHKLSGGEKRRLYLLTVLMRNPNFLILDEPTNDLDIITLNVLENYLEEFAGCLIVVSHDRYFMDKVVDHLMVLEGDGRIRFFPGNYTQYRNACEEAAEKESAGRPVSAPVSRPIREKTQKLTYKERQEFQRLETEIETLEAVKKELEEQLGSGTLGADDLTTLSVRYAACSEELDEKSMRWLELSERA